MTGGRSTARIRIAPANTSAWLPRRARCLLKRSVISFGLPGIAGMPCFLVTLTSQALHLQHGAFGPLDAYALLLGERRLAGRAPQLPPVPDKSGVALPLDDGADPAGEALDPGSRRQSQRAGDGHRGGDRDNAQRDRGRHSQRPGRHEERGNG